MDIEYLRSRISYDSETGDLTWKHLTEDVEPNDAARMPFNRQFAGKKMWNVAKRGYLVVRIKNKTLYAHRVAWAIHFGEWPKRDIDHINRNPLDNRICNLRDCSRSVNIHNKLTEREFYRGVNKGKNCRRYTAKFTHNKKVYRLGVFESAVDAAKAYDKKARETHGEYAITNFDENGNGKIFHE